MTPRSAGRYEWKRASLESAVTYGANYGYTLVGAHAYASHPIVRGLYLGSGLRSEVIFDGDLRVFRLGPSGALGWRSADWEVSLRPTVYLISLGVAAGVFVSWTPW